MPVRGDKATNDQSGSGESSSPPIPEATMEDRSESRPVTPTQKPCKAKMVMSDSSNRTTATVLWSAEGQRIAYTCIRGALLPSTLIHALSFGNLLK